MPMMASSRCRDATAVAEREDGAAGVTTVAAGTSVVRVADVDVVVAAVAAIVEAMALSVHSSSAGVTMLSEQSPAPRSVRFGSRRKGIIA